MNHEEHEDLRVLRGKKLLEALYARRFVIFAVFGIFACGVLARPSVFLKHQKRVAQNLSLQIPHIGFAETVSDLESFWV